MLPPGPRSRQKIPARSPVKKRGKSGKGTLEIGSEVQSDEKWFDIQVSCGVRDLACLNFGQTDICRCNSTLKPFTIACCSGSKTRHVLRRSVKRHVKSLKWSMNRLGGFAFELIGLLSD